MSSSDILKAMLNQDLEKEKKRKQDYQASKKAAAMTPNEKARRSGAQRDEAALNKAGKSLIPPPSSPKAQESDNLFTRIAKTIIPATDQPAAKNTGNTFVETQRKLYNSTLKPAQDFTSRVAARIADPFNIGPKVMPKAPNVPEFVKDTMKPAQTTSEKTADVVGNIAGLVAPTGIAYKTGGKLAGKVASNLGNKALPTLKTSMPKVAETLKRTATGAGAGAAYGIANETADSIFDTRNDGGQSLAQRAGNVGLEATLFGSTDGLLNIAGHALKGTPIPQKAGELASKTAEAISRLRKQKETPSLTSALPPSAKPEPLQAIKAEPTKPALSEQESKFMDFLQQHNRSLDDFKRELETRSNKHLNDELTYLANSQKQGVTQGALIRDEYGTVVDRAGRQSNNPQWYQDFHAEKGRAPSQKELVDLAYKRLREGGPEAPANKDFLQAENMMKFIDNIKQKTETQPIHGLNDITTPEAPQMKGNLFTNLFGNQGVGASALKSTKQISKGPLTTEGQIVKNGIKNDKQGVKEAVNAQARATYQNFVDRLSPLKTISNKTYDTAMDASRANNIANTIIHDKFVTPEGKVVGSGLKEIFKKVARGQDKQFVDYLTLRHALTRMQRGERVYAEQLGMTPEKVKERIQMYNERHPGFAAIAKEWDGFHANVLKNYGVDEGLISPELYKALREKNPNYSPMRRQFSRSEKPGKSFLAKTTSASFSGQKAPIKEVSPTGSVRNIIDPRKSTIESVGAWANVAMRNRVMQAMVDAIKRNPEAFNGIAEIVQKPKNATDLRKVLIDGGEDDFVEALNGDFVNLFKTTKVDGENIVRAMVKGEPVYLQVHDPEVVKTLINMGPQASNLLIDVFSSLSNLTKRGATGALAPVFAVKGATMDLVQSAIQAKNPVQQAAYTIHAIFSGIGDKLNIPGLKNMAEEFRLAGGEYSAALKGDKPLNKSISDMTRYPLLSRQSIGKGLGNAVKSPFKALESIGNIAENAPRMAAYKGELKRLGGEKTPDNIRQAMSAARESTVNFSRKGALSNDIEAFIPYNNAAVQGTYRIMRGFKENKIKTVASVAMLAVLPKMYEYMQFHDDPDYQNLPARERYRFLIVNKNEDGTFTKIPMEPAYNSIGEMTIEALRKYVDQDPNAFKGSLDALANAWLPPFVTGALQGATQDSAAESGIERSIAGAVNSTVMAPFVATIANKSFTGAPIVSQAVSDRSPQYQSDEKTSGIAKKVGELTGMSPMKADYFIRAYGGDVARLILPLSSAVGQGNTRNTLLRNFIVDPTYTNNLTNDFYTAKDKLSRAYRDNQEAGALLPSWYDDKLRKALASTAKGSVSHKLSNLSDQKKKLNADTSLSPTEKADKLKAIQQETNQIYLDINSILSEKGVIRR
jgi:hypothetical protein